VKNGHFSFKNQMIWSPKRRGKLFVLLLVSPSCHNVLIGALEMRKYANGLVKKGEWQVGLIADRNRTHSGLTISGRTQIETRV